MSRFRLVRTSDRHILCTDGKWRPKHEVGGFTGTPAKTYQRKSGAGGAQVHLAFVTEIEEVD